MNSDTPPMTSASPPSEWEELTPAPLGEKQFERFLGAMQTASRDALTPAEEAVFEETLLAVEPAPLGIGRESRLARAMDEAAPHAHARSYAAWYGRAAACAAALILLVGGALIFRGNSGVFDSKTETFCQVNRQILESREDSLHWDKQDGIAYLTYDVLYQDSFYLCDDATGCVAISVPNRCRVEVPEEII